MIRRANAPEPILAEILADHHKVLEDPEPVVRVHTLSDSSVDSHSAPVGSQPSHYPEG